MQCLATFPGKFGDILWALPTVRAIAEKCGDRVDLCISDKYSAIAPLIQEQPYIFNVIHGRWPQWDLSESTPTDHPTISTTGYDRVFHLGYQTWPTDSLPFYIAKQAGIQVDLARPWIDNPLNEDMRTILAEQLPQYEPADIAVGFSDEHFELKFGLVELLQHLRKLQVIYPKESRWDTEARGCFGEYLRHEATNWEDAADLIAEAKVFLGCCSGLHVLAVAMGKPCVLMEPSEARWNNIFWPLGKTGRVHLVMGNDGRPTWDARAVRHALDHALAEASCSR